MAKKLYIETYGCQMNVADSEVVASILKDEGYLIRTTFPRLTSYLSTHARYAKPNKDMEPDEALKSMKEKGPTACRLDRCMAERLKGEVDSRRTGGRFCGGT